jgi:predicted enzyme related to lactoylglutathione lyase
MLAKAKAMATIPAEDLERGVKFYRDVLELKQLDAPEGSAVFEAGEGSTIFMYQRTRTIAEHTAITFTVADLEDVVTGLSAKGVKFEQYDFGEVGKTDAMGIINMGGAKLAWLIDPEGNILALTEG